LHQATCSRPFLRMISGSLRGIARKLPTRSRTTDPSTRRETADAARCEVQTDLDRLARLTCPSYTCAMPTAEQYRKSADQCRRVAGNTEDRHGREALLRIAAQWDRLAEHKERKEAEKA
jgi:hypothetical protein